MRRRPKEDAAHRPLNRKTKRQRKRQKVEREEVERARARAREIARRNPPSRDAAHEQGLMATEPRLVTFERQNANAITLKTVQLGG
jgi:hypothetical protein